MSHCSKVAYGNQFSAELALRAIRRKSLKRGTKAPTGSYWCRACTCWHLTSKSASRPAPWAR